ncbi:MAG: SpoIID/LytB domain protein [Candidatus Uhrbacteria bacterium GW2011_GWF2_39_13]|uniref:SpoIID/LytB domain protein n=1 Tax=Candidatus Uhrbacteria bacterium GW2011_GWF2_39_13 TaxID=1618995 RepID=A0A0G0QQY4_9BACT|nr:MAG: SpoIID/LytB domain protein [Candidatus Uhrbacteria bacterium GW2011_GWF2_39_13]HAU66060.1 hypothetical protein [Candidatus Uhrbacteria bacterium]
MLGLLICLSLSLSSVITVEAGWSETSSPTSSCPTFTSTLTFGMKDIQVEWLQDVLSQLPGIYPEGLVTGYFGSLTREAVISFQKQEGIDPVGQVGPITREHLNLFIKDCSFNIPETISEKDIVIGIIDFTFI